MPKMAKKAYFRQKGQKSLFLAKIAKIGVFWGF